MKFSLFSGLLEKWQGYHWVSNHIDCVLNRFYLAIKKICINNLLEMRWFNQKFFLFPIESLFSVRSMRCDWMLANITIHTYNIFWCSESISVKIHSESFDTLWCWTWKHITRRLSIGFCAIRFHFIVFVSSNFANTEPKIKWAKNAHTFVFISFRFCTHSMQLAYLISTASERIDAL